MRSPIHRHAAPQGRAPTQALIRQGASPAITAPRQLRQAQPARRHPAWPADDRPAPKRMQRVLALATRDDACREALDLRRLEVFERLNGESMKDAIAAHPALLGELSRVGRAIDRVPAMLGAKRLREQLKAGGGRALDHVEVRALVRREAQERNRLFEYVNLAAIDARFDEFPDWAESISRQKIGKRKPEQINYEQGQDLLRTVAEPLAALNAADAWPRARVGLATDMHALRAWQASRRNPEGAQGEASRNGVGKTFDLTVRDRDGEVCSNVEVTTVTAPVRKPGDLAAAVQHGIGKSKGLHEHKGQWREVSIAVQWDQGREPIERGRYIDYRGDGHYDVFQSGGEGKGDRWLYERDIIADDLPHYLQRHRSVWKWLECVNVLSQDGEMSYRVIRTGSDWDVERRPLAPGSPLAQRRRARREARGWLQSTRPAPHLPDKPASGDLWSHRPSRQAFVTRET